MWPQMPKPFISPNFSHVPFTQNIAVDWMLSIINTKSFQSLEFIQYSLCMEHIYKPSTQAILKWHLLHIDGRAVYWSGQWEYTARTTQ